jgi:Ca2+-binding RTX toxin-like protein
MKLVLHDIEFILQQILTAEAHAAGTEDSIRGLVADPLLPLGLRTVNGSYNNLIPGREDFGAADRVFPLLLPQFFREAEGRPAGFFGPTDLGDPTPTTYASNGGNVFDSQPRVISNLIADQTVGNPAAVAAQIRNNGSGASPDGSLDIPNIAPDEGLSAPFNSWFTLFGQFFDHGLDLVNKGGGTVFIPLKNDDPLVLGDDGILGTPDDLPANLRFMAVTRTLNDQVSAGTDGVLGTSDDVHRHVNQTTPFVDQNQTYTSHPAHQAFLREYVIDGNGSPVATGRFLDGDTGGLANWADIKEQARTVLGIELSDFDIHNVPTLLTDEYGRLTLSPNGQAQLMTTGGAVSGNRAAPISTSDAIGTGHAFLDDIAHHANPRAGQVADADPGTADDGNAGTYDNEMLDAHFITGDGRGNENIGLTTVHHIFHAEHNRLVQHVMDQVTGTALEASFRLPNGEWNGERLFQAARFGTEMQYQHLVFEEFARKIQPQVDVFAGYDVNIDPAITAEFAHVVYRFGHSMLTDTIARVDPDGTPNDIGLIQAFLNPVAFNASGVDANAAAASIVNGMTRQVANHIDEFVVEAVRNNLVGLPLDLGAVNMTRARDAGVPSLNAARQQFFAATSESALAPYESWIDFRDHIKNPESLVNFIAAYGTHASVTGATTMADKRAAATLLVNGGSGAPADRLDFLNANGAYAGGSLGGMNNIDFWIGGLAERTSPFGGLLGSTFNFVFETQMEKLQDGDRLYYLSRTAGLNFLFELENNSFADLVMRNLPGVNHLPGDIFSTPDFTFEAGNPSTWAGHISQVGSQLRFNGGEHIVFGGTAGNDNLRAGDGDDTLYGDGGNDRLEGGAGNDFFIGGDGNDVLVDIFGDDNFKGGEGNDVISTGSGLDLAIGGEGHDFIVHGSGLAEAFGGEGNDLVIGGTATDTVFGGAGDDWIEGGGQADLLQGDNGDPFQVSSVIGNDVIRGDGGNDDYDMESGDDIGMTGEGTERIEGMLGFDWAITKGDSLPGRIDLAINRVAVLPPAEDAIRDRFDMVEAASGWNMNDEIKGDDLLSADLVAVPQGAGTQNNALNNAAQIALINGLQDLIGAGVTSFSGGNILLGGGGNDLIEGRAGDDILDGDAWLNVQLQVGAQRFDSLTQLQAQALAGTLDPGTIQIVREILIAAGGNDRLDGGLGNDTMRGRGGNDTYVVDAAADLTIEAAGAGADIHAQAAAEGVDLVESSITITSLANNIENLTLTGAAVINGTGNALHNVIRGNTAANTLAGLDGNDTMFGGDGNDNLQGSAGNDILNGEIGNDTMTGGADNDVLDGGVGNDNMQGNAGDDTYFVDVAADVTTENVAEGTDLVNSLVTRTLGANLENLTLIGSAAINGTGNELDNIITGNSAANVLSGLAGIDTMIGGAGNDTYSVDNALDTTVENLNEGTDLVNSALNWTLAANVENLTLTGTALTGTGNELANIITGNAQNNLIDGAAGADAMAGGAGDDIYIADNIGDTVSEGAGAGTDLVNSSVNFTLTDADVENLTLTGADAISGTGNAAANVITGNDAANVLSGLGGADTLLGNGGDDTLDGGAGDDAMTGGLGNDTYVVSSLADTVNELAGGGTDLVRANLTYSIQALAEIENLTLFGNTAINGTGNEGNNVITANGGVNSLFGMGGNDTLDSGGGNDTLDGGLGADAMSGGIGNDVYIVDEAGDTVTEAAAAGTDRVESAVSWVLGANVENLTLTGTANNNGAGNDAANVIIGNSGNNRIDGGLGNDNMQGGAGDDTYVVNAAGDVTTEAAGGGIDTVESAVTRILGAEIENLTLTGAGNINGSGNAQNNVLTGNDGNNTLNGGAGADTMAGGLGNDIYVIDDTLDTVSEGLAAGTDTVQSAISFTLGDNVENLTLTGTAASNGTGNALANTIVGNASANTIDGGAGVDAMSGGAGDDTYLVDNSADTVTEAANAGIDTVVSSASYTLTDADVENLTLTGAAVAATGNAASNVLIGNDAANTLTGGGANDRLVGGAGNDSLIGGAGDDLLVFGSGFGNDTVTGFDASPDAVGAQDRLDISGLGITAATFTGLVTITAQGADTLITIGAETILLTGVTPAQVNAGDFVLA